MVQTKREFIVNDKGRKKGVVLPVKEYQALLEDLRDLAVIAERRDEPSEPLAAVKKRLERRWYLTT